MTTPVFPDCAFPDHCECAARSYEFEAEKCVWPAIQAAASLVGMEPMKFIDLPKGLPPRPHPIALPPIGSAIALGRTDNLAADLVRAITMAGGEKFTELSDEDARRLIFEENVSAGLRAEGGGGGVFVLWLYGRKVTFANGTFANVALIFANVPRAGDCVYWSIYARKARDEPSLWCATFKEVESLISMLAYIGGGISTEEEHRPQVPDDATMEELRKL